ncbi:Zn-ribbon domain-containing OB-fold protein [Rhodococcus xishaensis]|uniref:DNA-binding protein n=1 Tax=Rhodococcus xishaensis TaxID=2487364 RepID=A0A3S3A2K6_9NOCA|nr:OB-fold nucleic acid binding domain-containing protein [Rhodococcus xishaensis]RVW00649.1 DNA-binding protein [Rhodococcus xishaensis]
MTPGKSGVAEQPLRAPLNLKFDYTRSVGPTIGAFVTALRDRKVIGARGSDGRIHVPPPEFDPSTHEPMTDFVDVSDTGTVVSWTWMPDPIDGQPLTHPFAWALIKLDGADTSILHAVDAGSPDAMSTGMRVRVRWADERTGHIRDIACFEPGESDSASTATASGGDPVTGIITPVDLDYTHTASFEESFYLRGLAAGKVIGGRTGPGAKVYVPPRSASPTEGIPTTEQVEVSDKGIVTTFCIVNVPFMGQQIKPPYVAAYVLLDGADIPFLHLILDCDASEVRMGMRIEAVWKPKDEWEYSLKNISHFRPTGEPDADYDTYKHHL